MNGVGIYIYYGINVNERYLKEVFRVARGGSWSSRQKSFETFCYMFYRSIVYPNIIGNSLLMKINMTGLRVFLSHNIYGFRIVRNARK